MIFLTEVMEREYGGASTCVIFERKPLIIPRKIGRYVITVIAPDYTKAQHTTPAISSTRVPNTFPLSFTT